MISLLLCRAINSAAVRTTTHSVIGLAVFWMLTSMNPVSLDAGASSTELSPDAARALDAKLRSLTNPATAQGQSFQPIVISEWEANSYLKYRGQEFLPKGVNDPEIHIAGPDSVTGEALVDFGVLNQGSGDKNDWSAQMLGLILSGKQRVSATGKLVTGNGQGKVTISSVTIGNTTVPQLLVDFLLQNYLQARYKIDLSKPFELPDHVTHIDLSSGRATFFRSLDKAARTSQLTK
jgi:hypothetical protein